MASERSVSLETLLRRLPQAYVNGNRDVDVRSITIDSRAVAPGALFVALRGSHIDGHRFIDDAAARGARGIVVEEQPAGLASDLTIVRVPDTRRALSALAAAFYGDPSQHLDVIGVTGTNGKTTTTHMVAAILDAAGIPCGRIGTVGAEFGEHRRLLENTTPLPPTLHELFATMRDDGAKAIAMEVSSHSLALDRVDDVSFRAAVLTNVGRDHLDFHRDLETYAAAKRSLFDLAQTCIVNLDDSYGARWIPELRRDGHAVVSYGRAADADVIPTEIVSDAAGVRFTVSARRYKLLLAGPFNLWNALAAIGVARSLGVDDATSARGLAAIERIPGRMERIAGDDGVNVVVDYAHTPDALESALRALRETTRGAIAIVFGCGGDRDRGKRPEMGAVAAHYADRVYVTNDNPRSEDPEEIAEAIVAGTDRREVVVELNRRRAIERAVGEARPGDVVLVAGKGHETYQIIGDRILPFDDVQVARTALAGRQVLQ